MRQVNIMNVREAQEDTDTRVRKICIVVEPYQDTTQSS